MIYVYDNNSTDKTSVVAKEALKGKRGEIAYVKNQGKGNVVLRFFADVEADLYVLIDGDSTYDCPSLKIMVDKVLDEQLDMLVGRRIEIQPDPNNKIYRKGHRFGNIFLTNSVSWIFDQKADHRNFKDMLSGYRVLSRRYVKSFLTLSSGFEIETQLNVHALQLKMPCGEVDTPYYARPEGSTSKLSTYKDGLKILYTIIKLYSTEKLDFFEINVEKISNFR
ncbi:glycosyltransferase [Parasutterella sp.]|uniref:glycosyltransferase n=1 Tax=Parasutterella sp. TaxID=2049037 RepID=UPI0035210754